MQEVYPPSEDTFLLAEAITLEENESFLEVGCGCGYVSLTAATISNRVVAVDISLPAVMLTRKNALRNGLQNRMEIVQSDLLSAIQPNAKFSVIAFNPPYLPEDDATTDLDHALIGGKHGVELAIKFLQQAIVRLEKEGTIYLVISSSGNIKQLEKTVRNSGFGISVKKRRDFFFEKIAVLEIRST